MTPKDQNVKLCKTRINNSPQAGLGEPTWPDKLSPSSIPLMTQEVSVMPYPSDTRQPKQLWSIIILFSQKKKRGKRTKNMYVLGIVYSLKKKKTYIFRKSMTSGDKGEAPDVMKRTRPPSLSLILLKTNLSHMGDAFFPETIINRHQKGNSYLGV